MNIPVMPLSKSVFTIMPLCISIFSILIFNHTSLSILKVLLISFQLPPSFAACSNSLGYVLLCYTFSSLGCHNLAKRLSHYLYFFSFLLLLRWSMGIITWLVTESQRCDSSHRMVMSQWSHSHRMWQRDHLMDIRTVGDKVHSHNSNCIYSVANLMRTLSSSSCQMLIKEQLALFWLRS